MKTLVIAKKELYQGGDYVKTFSFSWVGELKKATLVLDVPDNHPINQVTLNSFTTQISKKSHVELDVTDSIAQGDNYLEVKTDWLGYEEFFHIYPWINAQINYEVIGIDSGNLGNAGKDISKSLKGLGDWFKTIGMWSAIGLVAILIILIIVVIFFPEVLIGMKSAGQLVKGAVKK